MKKVLTVSVLSTVIGVFVGAFLFTQMPRTFVDDVWAASLDVDLVELSVAPLLTFIVFVALMVLVMSRLGMSLSEQIVTVIMTALFGTLLPASVSMFFLNGVDHPDLALNTAIPMIVMVLVKLIFIQMILAGIIVLPVKVLIEVLLTRVRAASQPIHTQAPLTEGMGNATDPEDVLKPR